MGFIITKTAFVFDIMLEKFELYNMGIRLEIDKV